MKAGKYYVGDPCYVIRDDRWQEFCDLLSKAEKHQANWTGVIFNFDGKECFVSSTNYGDGGYYGSNDFEYSVDAGIIGAIPVEVCDPDALASADKRELGTIEDLGEGFRAYADPGRWVDEKNIYIDNLVITT